MPFFIEYTVLHVLVLFHDHVLLSMSLLMGFFFPKKCSYHSQTFDVNQSSSREDIRVGYFSVIFCASFPLMSLQRENPPHSQTGLAGKTIENGGGRRTEGWRRREGRERGRMRRHTEKIEEERGEERKRKRGCRL